MIPEVVNFKAFEFPALAETLTEWPLVVDLQCAEDANPAYNSAIKFLKKVVWHYQSLQQLAHIGPEERNHWKGQQMKTLVEISRLQNIMKLLETEH